MVSIRPYSAQFNPHAAADLAARILVTVETLAEHPERGRPIGADRRELVAISLYIIGYRIHDDTVEIIRIRHGARRPDG